MTFILQFPVVNPCSYCFREISDPETVEPSSVYGTPDKDWLTVKVAKLAGEIDDEVSFGPANAKIPLCVSCRDGLIRTLDPTVILDYRDGGAPKIVSGREPL